MTSVDKSSTSKGKKYMTKKMLLKLVDKLTTSIDETTLLFHELLSSQN